MLSLLVKSCREGENGAFPNLSWPLRQGKTCTNPKVLLDGVRVHKRYTHFALIARIDLLTIQKRERSISIQATELDIRSVPRAHERGPASLLCLKKLNSCSDMYHRNLTDWEGVQSVVAVHERQH